MMKYFVLILMLFPFLAYSQSDAKDAVAKGKIVYMFTSNHFPFEINREATLLFNDEASVFIHSKGKEPIVFLNGVNQNDGFYLQDKIGHLFYKNHTDNILKIRERIYNEVYISDEPVPDMDWEITGSEKKIGSFTCRLAKVNFRGRSYEAWFTEEIPISDGPWKFSGLPGMILEVASTDNAYRFLFKSIELPLKSKDEVVAFQNEGKYLPFEEFINAEDMEFEKMKKAGEANWVSSGGKPGGYTLTKTPTNPIELSYD